MIRQFVDRVVELDSLNKWYGSDDFEMIVIYGRRRVGKTYLLKKFLEEKNGFYFLCDMSGTKNNVTRFRNEFSKFFDEPPIASEDIDEVFSYISSKSGERTIIVMDEFSYLIEKDNGFASIFQRIVDEILKDSKIMLILCGSSISMMEEGVLSGRSPLYGRKTGHMRLGTIPFRYSREFLPDHSFNELVETYSAFGLIPYHLSFCKNELSAMENIEKVILNKNGRLYEEVDFLLKQELRETDVYRNILSKISSGSTRVTEIADKTAISSNTLSKYLQKLISLGFIRRDFSFTDKKRSRPLYRLNDNFMDFWFRFCEPYRSNLEIGELGPVLENIEKNFNTFVGRKFEDLVRKELFRYIPDFVPSKIEPYWLKGAELDIVCVDASGKKAAFAEVKWSIVDGKKVINDLVRKVNEISWDYDQVEYYVIAKDLKEPFENCITLEELMQVNKK